MVTRFVLFARRTFLFFARRKFFVLQKVRKFGALLYRGGTVLITLRSSMVGTQCRSALIFGGLFSQFPNETDSH